MLVMSLPAHYNILLGTAPHCSLVWCDFQPRLMSLPLAWLSRTSGPPVRMRLPLSLVVLLVRATIAAVCGMTSRKTRSDTTLTGPRSHDGVSCGCNAMLLQRLRRPDLLGGGEGGGGKGGEGGGGAVHGGGGGGAPPSSLLNVQMSSSTGVLSMCQLVQCTGGGPSEATQPASSPARCAWSAAWACVLHPFGMVDRPVGHHDRVRRAGLGASMWVRGRGAGGCMCFG